MQPIIGNQIKLGTGLSTSGDGTINANVGGIIIAPSYNNSTQYTVNDAVYYYGGTFGCHTSPPSVGHIPFNRTYWRLIGGVVSLTLVLTSESSKEWTMPMQLIEEAEIKSIGGNSTSAVGVQYFDSSWITSGYSYIYGHMISGGAGAGYSNATFPFLTLNHQAPSGLLVQSGILNIQWLGLVCRSIGTHTRRFNSTFATVLGGLRTFTARPTIARIFSDSSTTMTATLYPKRFT